MAEENNNNEQSDQLFGEGEEVTRDRLKDINITEEMEKNYLTYAMSVIVSRALPDVRDGLKPVHRRILYAMKDLGLTSSAKFRKSATVVGEVLGKYHPHGDTAVYDSLVRLAQDFSMRYMLINGQGNFGSVDGDNAAAMRYTEVKLQKITDEMLADIEKETVDFRDNYDGSQREPTVLPTKIPQLLLNGGMGIAVAMATSIPPHNLREVMDAVIHLLDDPEAGVDDLMQHIKGPDFPTGGTIYDQEAIKTMYATGRGGIVMRARANIEESGQGRHRIIFSEIPYQVNKSTLITKIADLVRDKKIMHISDIRDESNREGMRIVIELMKSAYPKKVLNQLYKMSRLQTRFNMNMIALVDGLQPRLLNLKQVIGYFIAHRKEVIVRRTEFDLQKAKDRAHILEGLKVALDHIDAVIATIRGSATKEIAHDELMEKFSLSDKQATAILEMRLQTLAGLERQKIEDELAEKLALIIELESILMDPSKILTIIREESLAIKEKYGDERKTEVVPTALGDITSLDTVPNKPMIVTITEENYVKRMPPTTFRAQKRGGKGVIGLTTKEDDEIMGIYYAMNHDDILFFTDKGRVFQLKAFEIPEAARTAKGQAIINLLQLEKDERVTSVLVIGTEFKGKYLIMGTKEGTVKKTEMNEYKNLKRNGLIAIKLRKGDSLEWVRQVDPQDEIIIVTNGGKCIRFDEADARPMGRSAMGVRGIRLKKEDFVVEMNVVKAPDKTKLFVIMENGIGKCTEITEYRKQNRGGAGILTAHVTKKTGKIVGARAIEEGVNADLIIVSKSGQIIRLQTDNIPEQGRATQGVYIMRVRGEDKVASLSLISNPLAEEGEEEEVDENQEVLPV